MAGEAGGPEWTYPARIMIRRTTILLGVYAETQEVWDVPEEGFHDPEGATGPR